MSCECCAKSSFSVLTFSPAREGQYGNGYETTSCITNVTRVSSIFRRSSRKDKKKWGYHDSGRFSGGKEESRNSDRDYKGEEVIRKTYGTSSEQACSESVAVFGDL